MKIVTTAVFSVIMLSKQISLIQWLAIITLTSGVVLVQLSQSHDDSTTTGEMKRNSMIGFLSVLCGSVTSGFAGVYFEMILKNSSTSLWIRNIQLSSIGVITSLVCTYQYVNFACIRSHNYYYSYRYHARSRMDPELGPLAFLSVTIHWSGMWSFVRLREDWLVCVMINIIV